MFENMFKTEFLTVLSENYQNITGSTLRIDFNDDMQFTVKKTTWERGGTRQLQAIHDHSAKLAVITPKGKAAVISIAPGLPKDTSKDY